MISTVFRDSGLHYVYLIQTANKFLSLLIKVTLFFLGSKRKLYNKTIRRKGTGLICQSQRLMRCELFSPCPTF